MTPYARRMAAGAALVAALATTSAIAQPAQHANPRTNPEPRIAPGGNLTSVVNATARLGWPHPVQAQERRDILALTYWHGVAKWGDRGAVLYCRFGPAMGRARCRVAGTSPRGVGFVADIVWKVWEDGSYRGTTVAPVRDYTLTRKAVR